MYKEGLEVFANRKCTADNQIRENKKNRAPYMALFVHISFLIC